MAISREEIEKIAQEAADKVTISKRCKELGEMILDVKQDLWHAMDNLRETRELNLPYGFELAKIWAEGAKRRYMTPFWTPEFTTEELVLLNAPVEKGLKLIKEGKDIEAAFAFEEARKAAHEMLFQKVVACECGEAKAIEKKLGEEALGKILATKESNPIQYGTCYEDAWRFLSKEEEGELIHGSLEIEGKRIGHAWVELPTGFIWEPETGKYFTREAFNIAASPIEEHRYTVEEAAIMLTRVGKHGPWTEEEKQRILKGGNPATRGIRVEIGSSVCDRYTGTCGRIVDILNDEVLIEPTTITRKTDQEYLESTEPQIRVKMVNLAPDHLRRYELGEG